MTLLKARESGRIVNSAPWPQALMPLHQQLPRTKQEIASARELILTSQYKTLFKHIEEAEWWLKSARLSIGWQEEALNAVSNVRNQVMLMQKHRFAWEYPPEHHIDFLDVVQEHFSDKLKAFLVMQRLEGRWK